MHKDFLSYIMHGLSRGLFPVQPPQSTRFDEEAFLLREARARREEARKSQEESGKGEAAPPHLSGRDRSSSRKTDNDPVRLSSRGRPCGAV